jgi:hypothetical protein
MKWNPGSNHLGTNHSILFTYKNSSTSEVWYEETADTRDGKYLCSPVRSQAERAVGEVGAPLLAVPSRARTAAHSATSHAKEHRIYNLKWTSRINHPSIFLVPVEQEALAKLETMTVYSRAGSIPVAEEQIAVSGKSRRWKMLHGLVVVRASQMMVA